MAIEVSLGRNDRDMRPPGAGRRPPAPVRGSRRDRFGGQAQNFLAADGRGQACRQARGKAAVEAAVELGLLEKSDQGPLNAPFDEIVIHAELRDAA